MQINPFGFPLGAGPQSAPATGATGLGFADALGLAVQGGAAPAPIGLVASTGLPGNFTAKLSQTLLAEAQPVPTAAALPGLQQPTSLSELMATAARLPAAEPVPGAEPAPTVGIATTDSEPAAIAAEMVPELPSPAAGQQPATKPTQVKAGADAVVPAPSQENEAPPEDASLPDAPEAAAPARPQKGRVPVAAAEAEPAVADAQQAAVPAEMLAATVVAVPQPAQQSQAMLRETAPQTGTVTSGVKKAATIGAPSADAPQAGASAATPDFARAVTAKTESAGSEANPDSQPQADPRLAVAGKHDASAPGLPQAVHGATATSAPVPATAPAAEPVIEARAGHLGHSLGVEIARKVELGEETLRIRLNPIELGRIEVTLAFDDKGSLQATVRTESTQAMDLLRQDAGDLARTLDQAGVRTDTQSFRFENRGGDSGGQQAQQQHNQNRGQFASSDDDAAAAEPVYRAVRSDGQVDLLA